MTDMGLCKQKNVGLLGGVGKSKVSVQKAYGKAVNDFLSQGSSGCLGGVCGVGGASCSFRPTSMSFDYAVEVKEKGVTQVVTVSGTGECYCA
jgi:hypothetical protein